jgi:hypothetical protein
VWANPHALLLRQQCGYSQGRNNPHRAVQLGPKTDGGDNERTGADSEGYGVADHGLEAQPPGYGKNHIKTHQNLLIIPPKGL